MNKMESELANYVKEGGSKHFGILGTQFLITYKTYLNKENLKRWLSTFEEIVNIYIAYHNPDKDFNYLHTAL